MLEVTCPNCMKVLSIPPQYAGKQGKCNSCGGMITVPPLQNAVPLTESFAAIEGELIDSKPPPREKTILERLNVLMSPEEQVGAGIAKLSTAEKEVLLQWAIRVYSLGQHVIEDIDEIKYGGRLVILNDGTRWEVDEYEASTVELWSTLDKVLIVDNEMYNIEDSEKVSVSEET